MKKEKQITIEMPKKLLTKWLKALRSGKYKQGLGSLHDPDGNTYCCLGVLHHVVSGKNPMGYRSYSSSSFLRKYGISFKNDENRATRSPYLPSLDRQACAANDQGYTFKKIAQAIERCSRGTRS
jgi:hypothetical protein